MPSCEVTGLNVIAVYVEDLERAKTFYIEHLGFKESADEMPPGIMLEGGSVSLYLEGGRNSGTADADKSEFSPCFAVASVKKSYDALKQAGVCLLMDYQEFAPTFAMFRFADPDGNAIEIAGAP